MRELLIAVSNRHLCRGDFLKHISAVVGGRPHALLLREKDLPEDAYADLAQSCAVICDAWGVPLIAHTFSHVVRDLKLPYLHMSMDAVNDFGVPKGLRYGVSVHSAQEAAAAERSGASYVIAGHIFATDCKKKAKPRGLAFLRNICATVTIPVYAIGGIRTENASSVMAQRAQGICVMSSLMKAEEPEALIKSLKQACAGH